MKTAAVAVAILGLIGALSPHSLDGTRWRMRYRSPTAWLPVWKADLMSFEGGRFRSAESASYGFADSPYGAKSSVGKISWTSLQRNPDGERALWQGEVSNGRMTGTLTWTHSNGRSRVYVFSAQSRPRSRK